MQQIYSEDYKEFNSEVYIKMHGFYGLALMSKTTLFLLKKYFPATVPRI